MYEKIGVSTKNAIEKRMKEARTQFFIGVYFYEVNEWCIRRRMQCEGLLPLTDWAIVARWDNDTENYIFYIK